MIRITPVEATQMIRGDRPYGFNNFQAKKFNYITGKKDKLSKSDLFHLLDDLKPDNITTNDDGLKETVIVSVICKSEGVIENEVVVTLNRKDLCNTAQSSLRGSIVQHINIAC